MGLVRFSSYHTIPNIDATNNKFVFEVSKNKLDFVKAKILSTGKASYIQLFEIPIGAYEINDIERYLRKEATRRYPKLHISIKSLYFICNEKIK